MNGHVEQNAMHVVQHAYALMSMHAHGNDNYYNVTYVMLAY